MSLNEPKVVEEIHRIRERHHEERKNWSREQYIEHYNRIGDELAKKLSLRKAKPIYQEKLRKAG